MQRIGHGARRLLAPARAARWGWAVAGAIAAVVPAIWMWGFTVDDALISVRYARHVAAGLGWRFDVHGPATDGVTPLPWPLLLAPFARADALVVLGRAKALGLLVWGGTGAALGARVGAVTRAPSWARAAALAVLALSVPAAAHAVSGMETPLATALATAAALLLARPWAAAVLAGLAASLRPELAAWAVALSIGSGAAARVSPGRVLAMAAAALAPFAGCALVRALVWGRPVPLSLLAKPSDLHHGLAYAGAACVVTLVPALVMAPIALRRTPQGAVIAAAGLVHVGALTAVGGDWMPYARLMVPIVPSLALAGALASAHARALATAARSAAAIAVGAVLLARGGDAGRSVGPDRRALVASATPALRGATHIAALDVGWVGAATEADIVDLAGVTDPEVASLPGGHTSKHVGSAFLLARGTDALLLYAPYGLAGGDPARWTESFYPRAVERRLSEDPVIARAFTGAAWLPLGKQGGGYVLLRRAVVR